MHSDEAERTDGVVGTRFIASAPQPISASQAVFVLQPTPALQGEPVLEAIHLKKDFAVGAGKLLGSARAVHAVEDTSLALYPGKATALVGESGSGKTTVARLLARLYEPTSGSIRFQGAPVTKGSAAIRNYRRHVQYIFQDPFSSLNPVHGVRYHLARALRL